MPLHLVKKMCEVASTSLESLDIQKILPENWGAVKGGKKGIRALFLTYPENLVEWRAKGGRTTHLNHPSLWFKRVDLPTLNARLAEFIGIHLGDGTLSQYSVKISQDSRYDLPYVSYIKELTRDLFGVLPTIRKEKHRNLIYVQLFSKKVCECLHDRWSMPYGDKIRGKAKIPCEIMEDKELAISCLRGLIDTDGSVSKAGNSISVRFSSHNKTLLDQVEYIGKSLGIFTFRNPVETGTKSWDNVIRYFHIVGSSNLRHIVRFHRKFAENELLRKSEIIKYYETYKGINLPFRVSGPVV